MKTFFEIYLQFFAFLHLVSQVLTFDSALPHKENGYFLSLKPGGKPPAPPVGMPP